MEAKRGQVEDRCRVAEEHHGFYEAAGENVIVTVNGVDANDKPTHNEWTGKFDGKDYPVIGDPNSDVRSYTKIGDRALGFNVKKGARSLLAAASSSLPTAKAAR